MIRSRLKPCPTASGSERAFPGNVIPAGRIDPVSRRLADLFPEPNQPGNALGQNNYIRSAGSTINTDKWDARVDHTFGQNTRMFGRYSQQKDVRLVPGPLPPPVGGGRNTTDTYKQALADLTHVFSPTLLATAQFSFSRALATQFGLSRGFDFASLGFPANINAIAVDQVPSATIADIPSNLSNAADSFTQYQPRNVWSMRGGLTNSRGAHNLKFGIDYRILNFNEGSEHCAFRQLHVHSRVHAGSYRQRRRPQSAVTALPISFSARPPAEHSVSLIRSPLRDCIRPCIFRMTGAFRRS